MTITRVITDLKVNGNNKLHYEISSLIVDAEVARCGDDLVISDIMIPGDDAAFKPFGLDTVKAAVKERLQQTLTLADFKEPLPESYETIF